MLEGSCLCGAVKYRIDHTVEEVTHCHCGMCRKQHGAAFATYASVPRDDLSYLSGLDVLSAYHSSGRVVRKFCAICGSSIEWIGGEAFADWVSIAVALLDTPFEPARSKQVHLDSRVSWYP